jgi:phosphoribosylaminoimidazole-succinocarboxamide synthase
MPDRVLLYEGKAKIIYATEDPEIVLPSFKDDATALMLLNAAV